MLSSIGVLYFHRIEITLNKEYNVDPQYDSCYCYDDLLLVPNGEAGRERERECSIRENLTRSRNRTYMRRTIRRKAATIDRYPKN